MFRPASLRPRCLPELSRTQKRHFLFRRRKPRSKVASYALTSAGVLFGAAFLVYASDSRAGIHEWLLVPALHAYTKDDPEKAHELAIAGLKSGLAPKDRSPDDASLSLKLWGKEIKNPIGIAAGFDKNGEAVDALLDLGFGYVEIGSVTPLPQDGNPKPRLFRLPSTSSIINRYGFNSDGHLVVLARLRDRVTKFFHAHQEVLPSTIFPVLPAGSSIDPYPVTRLLASPAGSEAQLADSIQYPRSLRPGQLLAVNLGKNKTSGPESVDDFVAGVHALGPYADVLVVNVSSPNTPGLRSLQQAGMIDELLAEVTKARDSLKSSVKPPVLVKVAPDLSEIQLDDIAQAALNSNIDGIIVANTTTSRPVGAGSELELAQAGGLSGPPLKPITIPVLTALYRATGGKIPLIGCGGIATGQDAIDYAKAGASAVQLYTSFAYHGVGLPRRIKDQVAAELQAQGKTWSELVGSGVQLPTAEELKKEREAKHARAEEHAHKVWLQEVASARESLAHIVAAIQAEEERIALQKTAFPVLIEEAGHASVSVASQSTIPSAQTNSPSSGIVQAGAAPATAPESSKETPGSTAPGGLGLLLSTWGMRANAPKTGKKLV